MFPRDASIVNNDLATAVDELTGLVERELAIPIRLVMRAPIANLREADRARRYASLRPKALKTLISPRIDKLLENVDSDYASVLVAAKRARQINSYYHNLGEGTFDEFPPPMVETRSKNYLDDRPGGSRPGQAQVPLPLNAERASARRRPWRGC